MQMQNSKCKRTWHSSGTGVFLHFSFEFCIIHEDTLRRFSLGPPILIHDDRRTATAGRSHGGSRRDRWWTDRLRRRVRCAVAGLRPDRARGGSPGDRKQRSRAGLLLPEPGPVFSRPGGGTRTARHTQDVRGVASRIARRRGADSAGSASKTGASRHHTASRWRRRRREAAATEFDARAEASVDAHWLNTRQARQLAESRPAPLCGSRRVCVRPVSGGARSGHGASKRGARFYEQTAVTKVRWTRKHAQLLLDGATIRADRVIAPPGPPPPIYKPLRVLTSSDVIAISS
jgi:hypothetical protein